MKELQVYEPIKSLEYTSSDESFIELLIKVLINSDFDELDNYLKKYCAQNKKPSIHFKSQGKMHIRII